MLKKCVSVLLFAVILFNSFAFLNVTAYAKEKQPVDSYDGQISKAFQDYRDEFIDALMVSKSKWQPSTEFGTFISFADLDFDGKNEFLVSSGGGSSHMVNTKIYSWDGYQIQEIKDLADPNYYSHTSSTGKTSEYGYYLNPSALNYYYNNDTHDYMITGTMGLRGGWAYSWSGLFTLEMLKKKLAIEYIRSGVYEVKTISSGVYENINTYYDGASYYGNFDSSQVISEEQFEKLKDNLLKNCDDLEAHIETLSIKTWNGYSVSQQHEKLKDLYNSFTFKKGFRTERDGWSIANYYNFFGYDEDYHISKERYNDVYGVSIPSIVYRISSLFEWGGNCYGLSLLALAQYYGIVDLKPYFDGEGNSLYNFGRDKMDTTMSGEEYYSIADNTAAIHMIENALVSQGAKEMRDCEVFNGDSDYSSLIEFLSSENARPLLVTLPTECGYTGCTNYHTMVINTNSAPLNAGNNRYVIPLYDCNFPHPNPNLKNPADDYYDENSYIIVNTATSEWSYYEHGNTEPKFSCNYYSLEAFNITKAHELGRSIKFYDVSGLEPSVFTRKLSLISKSLHFNISVGIGDLTVTAYDGTPLLIYENQVVKYIADNCILESISDTSGNGQNIKFVFDTDEKNIMIDADDADIIAFSENYILGSQIDKSYILGFDAEHGIASAKCSESEGKMVFAIHSLNSNRCIAVTENSVPNSSVSVAVDGNENNDKPIITTENTQVDFTSEGVDRQSVIVKTNNYILPGDTDGDGELTISDVTEIQKHLAEYIQFTDEQLTLADTNGDDNIDISDATHLQKYLAEFDGIVLGKQN